MKNLYNTYFLCSLFLLTLFVSCEQDNVTTTYKETDGITFSTSSLPKATVQPNAPEFTVDLFRGSTSGEQSGTINIKAYFPGEDDKDPVTPFEGAKVSGYSFKDGESITRITINIEPLDIGKNLTIELSIDKSEVSPNGIGSTKIIANKDYNWTSLGKGKYLDNWASGVEYEVEIRKAEGYNRYRVMNPYVETLKNDDGEWEDWIATSSAPFVEFWTVDNNLVRFSTFFIGVNYQADSKQPINAYHPLSFQDLSPNFNKWIDDKTVQLAPYYYVSGLGGWNNTQINNVIIITLP